MATAGPKDTVSESVFQGGNPARLYLALKAIGGTRENGVEKVAGMREAGSLEPKSPHGRQKANVRGGPWKPSDRGVQRRFW